MKLTRLLASLGLCAAMVAFAGTSATAQVGAIAPNQQFGIGVFAGGPGAAGVDTNSVMIVGGGGGFTLQYAFTPAIQAGLEFTTVGSSSESVSTTLYIGGIYVRWLFEGMLNPFIQAGFRVNGQSVTFKRSTGDITVDNSSNSLYAGFGLEYFASRNIGIYAMIEPLNLELDPSNTVFGFRNGRTGVEYFFGP